MNEKADRADLSAEVCHFYHVQIIQKPESQK